MVSLMALWASLAFAEDVAVSVPDGQVQSDVRRGPATEEYEALDQLKEMYDGQLDDKNAELSTKEAELQRLQQVLIDRAKAQGLVAPDATAPGVTVTPGSSTSPVGSTPSVAPTSSNSPQSKLQELVQQRTGRKVGDKVSATSVYGAGTSLAGPLVFSVPPGSGGVTRSTQTVVPAGSYVKVRILTGVEANVRDELPMLVQADHALVGPNRRRIDLRGCMVLLQVKGDLSTDRVVGQAVKLSCVREDGEHISRDINGYLTGEDSTFGVTGQLITRQGRVIAAAAVMSFAEAAGEAVATAQETRQVITNPLGGATQEVRNVDGNQVAYVAGTASSDAAGLIASWYLKYADQLMPAIAVGSGRDVWVVLLDTVSVPPLASGDQL